MRKTKTTAILLALLGTVALALPGCARNQVEDVSYTQVRDYGMAAQEDLDLIAQLIDRCEAGDVTSCQAAESALRGHRQAAETLANANNPEDFDSAINHLQYE